MNTSTQKQIMRYTVFALIILSGPLFIALTDPGRLPIALLTIPYVWLFVVLYVCSFELLKRIKQLTRRQGIIAAGVFASVPVILAVLQSIDQLAVRDVVLSLSLVLVAAVYIARADFIK